MQIQTLVTFTVFGSIEAVGALGIICRGGLAGTICLIVDLCLKRIEAEFGFTYSKLSNNLFSFELILFLIVLRRGLISQKSSSTFNLILK